MAQDQAPDEISEADRLAVARRYRAQRTGELRALVAPAIEGEVVEAGQFSRMPLEALAAIPVVGALIAMRTRLRGMSKGGTADVLVGLDRDTFYVLDYGITGAAGTRPVTLVERHPRSAVTVSAVSRSFMRDKVFFSIQERPEELLLYSSGLRTNPWAAGIIRALGGEAPEPMDLGSEEAVDSTGEPPSEP